MSWYDESGEPAKGKCPACNAETDCHNERCDLYKEPDPRHKVKDLAAGWHFRSPVGRLEFVERIVEASEATGWQVLIYTRETGPGYCWHAFQSDKVEAVPPRHGAGRSGDVAVVIHEWNYHGGPIQAGIVIGVAGRPDFNRVLVEAHQERGAGWTIISRLNGSDLTSETRPNKAQARTVVRQWAKLHSKALGIPVREEATR